MLEPVMIVSTFGRGLWLAESLLSQQIPVRWVDLSSQLGTNQPADIEGPFLLMQSQGLTDSQKDSWGAVTAGKPFAARELPRGLVFLTKDGPLEMKSSFLEMRMKAMGLISENQEYLSETTKINRKISLKKQFMGRELNEVWLSQWAHRFWSLQDLAPVESIRERVCFDLAERCWLRKPNGHQARLQSLSNNPLFTIHSNVEVEDISFRDRKTPSGLLLKNERSEFTPCSQLIWALTSSETKFLSSRLSERIFKSREKTPTKIWMRWEVRFDFAEAPDYFILLDDYEMPWSHTNMMVFVRAEKSDIFSVWMLEPAAQRFNRSYLETETARMGEFLNNRFPQTSIEITATPKEIVATTRELGPPLHGLYLEGIFQSEIIAGWDRFFQLGPESQELQGPNGSFLRESSVEEAIVKWWLKEQEIIRKREARMKARD